MEEIWKSACKKIQIPDSTATSWLAKIKARMSSDSGRIFHNWSDIVESKAPYLGNVNELLVFAVCFQYFEFDVKKGCAEENCKAFREFCSEAGYKDETNIKKIERLLGNENVEPYDGFEQDMQILQDLDLIVLGLPEDEYKNYTQLVRKEYSHLSDVSYKSMRLKILQTFLTIPTIYATDTFREKFEEKARFNIKSEIEDLKK
ncbi:uncharacterized protein LOC119647064 [Hermetia illucens]|nr:uncharacterized protein LOC119647064 [Hermetia illucens]